MYLLLRSYYQPFRTQNAASVVEPLYHICAGR
jgi:hypothetical protein